MDAQAWKTAAIVLAVVLPILLIALAFFIWHDHQTSKISKQQQPKWPSRFELNTMSLPPGLHFEHIDPEDGSWDQHQEPRVVHISPPPRAQLRGNGNLGNGIRGRQQQPDWGQRYDIPPQSPHQTHGDNSIPYAGNGSILEDPQEESYRTDGQRYGRQDFAEPSRAKHHGKGKHRVDR